MLDPKFSGNAHFQENLGITKITQTKTLMNCWFKKLTNDVTVLKSIKSLKHASVHNI